MIILNEIANSHGIKKTIFGYSAPTNDKSVVELLENAWGTPESTDMEQIEL